MLIYAVTSETTDLSMGYAMQFNKKYHTFCKYEHDAKDFLKQDYDDACHDFAKDSDWVATWLDDSSYKLEYYRHGKVMKSTIYRVEDIYVHQ